MRNGNWGRLAMAAAAASVIIFFVAGGVNGAILGEEWNAWAQALGPLNHAPSAGVGFVIWLIVAAIDGVACVWLYARLRATLGRGVATAAKAAIVVWVVGWVGSSLGQFALGGAPNHALAVSCAGGLVAALLGTIAAAAIYREA